MTLEDVGAHGKEGRGRVRSLSNSVVVPVFLRPVPLFMRDRDIGDVIFRERDIHASADLNESFGDHYLLERPSVFQRDRYHLISHAGLWHLGQQPQEFGRELEPVSFHAATVFERAGRNQVRFSDV